VLFVSLYDIGRAHIAATIMSELAAGRVNVQSAGSAEQLSDVDANVRVAVRKRKLGASANAPWTRTLAEVRADGAGRALAATGRVERGHFWWRLSPST